MTALRAPELLRTIPIISTWTKSNNLIRCRSDHVVKASSSNSRQAAHEGFRWKINRESYCLLFAAPVPVFDLAISPITLAVLLVLRIYFCSCFQMLSEKIPVVMWPLGARKAMFLISQPIDGQDLSRIFLTGLIFCSFCSWLFLYSVNGILRVVQCGKICIECR